MRQEKKMTKILKVTLASAMLIAGSSLAFAADNGRNGHTPNGTGIGDKGRSTEQQQLLNLDNMTTGSISNCQTQMWDVNGNCVVDSGAR
jgi:hypothetical protein